MASSFVRYTDIPPVLQEVRRARSPLPSSPYIWVFRGVQMPVSIPKLTSVCARLGTRPRVGARLPTFSLSVLVTNCPLGYSALALSDPDMMAPYTSLGDASSVPVLSPGLPLSTRICFPERTPLSIGAFRFDCRLLDCVFADRPVSAILKRTSTTRAPHKTYTLMKA